MEYSPSIPLYPLQQHQELRLILAVPRLSLERQGKEGGSDASVDTDSLYISSFKHDASRLSLYEYRSLRHRKDIHRLLTIYRIEEEEQARKE